MSTTHSKRGEADIRPAPLVLPPDELSDPPGGQKIEDYLATMGPPCTGETGQEVPELLATRPPAATAENRRGRPTVMDAEMRGKVCLLLSLGLSRRQVSTYLNIVHSTIANAMARDADFAESVRRAEEMSVIKPVLTIAEASRKNWRAAAWLLGRNERRVSKSRAKENQEDDESAP